MNLIKEHILQLEKELLKSEVRKSPQKISEILSEDFVEYCSNGCEYRYRSGDAFQAKEGNNELDWEIVDFSIKELSEDCILAMFKLIKHKEVDENKRYSLRSSIWKQCGGMWKMIFHQGTLSSKFE